LKQGVLSSALRYFALDRRSALGDLIGLLADLPEGISEISKAAKHSQNPPTAEGVVQKASAQSA
jgi:hypothetical protein